MKFIYSFETLVTGEIFMNIDDNEAVFGGTQRIGEWLATDVRDGSYVIPKVRKVIENESQEERIWMDGYDVLVKKDFSTIKCNCEEFCPEMVPCTLPTEMLYEILEIWIKAYEEHRNKQN